LFPDALGRTCISDEPTAERAAKTATVSMGEAIITEPEGRRALLRSKFLWPLLVAVTVAAAAVVWLLHHFDPNTPHGTPDPGGKRLAYLEHAARAAVPAGATAVNLQIHRYAWRPGGCDGGAAGWARAEVDLEYRETDVSEIDTAMVDLGWKRLTVQGGDAVPKPGNPYEADATLFANGPTWDFEFTAAPAQVPTHAC
jgi:hypothetical protein